MILSDEFVQKFHAAKADNYDARAYLVDYFVSKAERQLQNLNLTAEQKAARTEKCRDVVSQNLYNYIDADAFVEQTLKDLKNAIYLDRGLSQSSSKDIILMQRDIVPSKLLSDLDSINIPVKDKELARLFYIENKSATVLAEMYKCSETIIYVRLRRISKALSAQKASNSVSKEETFLYTK